MGTAQNTETQVAISPGSGSEIHDQTLHENVGASLKSLPSPETMHIPTTPPIEQPVLPPELENVLKRPDTESNLSDAWERNQGRPGTESGGSWLKVLAGKLKKENPNGVVVEDERRN